VKGLGLERIRRGFRRLCKTTGPRALILLYHRVSDLDLDPQLLSVSSRRFAAHLDHISRSYRVVTLQWLTEAIQHEPDSLDRCVAVTFDDGYVDNLLVAKPLLESYRIPATVFVTSGYLGTNDEFWWDELDRLLLQPSTLPPRLHLRINGVEHAYELGCHSSYSSDDGVRHRSWNVLEDETPTVRHRIYRDLCAALKPLSQGERSAALDELRTWAGKDRRGRHSHRCLSPTEVTELGSGDLIEVGAHSVSHPVLGTLDLAEQQSEIHDSRKSLEALVGKPVESFAYPFGTTADYTDQTVALVRNAGFRRACSNFPAFTTGRSDPYQLPRCIVRNWDLDTFVRLLNRWFAGRAGEASDGAYCH
jgi:peptidoglycan/xylan/chitin deacetylase (PgdA/CDA1 family)